LYSPGVLRPNHEIQILHWAEQRIAIVQRRQATSLKQKIIDLLTLKCTDDPAQLLELRP
jgi:hypothetical protein